MSTSRDACYCPERENNPELFADLPPGFCGVCAYCGKLGHTRCHPHQPVSHGWCDEHWQDQVEGRVISLSQIVTPLLILVFVLLPFVLIVLVPLFGGLWRWING